MATAAVEPRTEQAPFSPHIQGMRSPAFLASRALRAKGKGKPMKKPGGTRRRPAVIRRRGGLKPRMRPRAGGRAALQTRTTAKTASDARARLRVNRPVAILPLLRLPPAAPARSENRMTEIERTGWPRKSTNF